MYQVQIIPGCIHDSPYTISFSFQYHATSYHTTGMIEAFHIPGQAIPSYQSCHWVSGVLLTKYENYFCRLQYLFIGLHLLWTGSSGFCWHFKLQVEVYSELHPLFNWALPQGLLWIIHHKLFKIIYLALAIQSTKYSTQLNQSCIHCNSMAFEKQR